MRGRLRGAAEERLALMAPTRRLRLAQAEATIIRRAGAERPLRILDAGCGDGLLTLEMARRHPHWELLGGDVNEQMLSAARARAAARGQANARFARIDVSAPIDGARFDVVMAIECLSEIPDDDAALRSLAGALAPGGLLVAQVPERSWRPILPGSSPVWREEVRHGYSAEEISGRIGALGLERIELLGTQRGTVTLAQELRDRVKRAPLTVRAPLYPLMVAAARLELRGASWGPARALLLSAQRPGDGAGVPG